MNKEKFEKKVNKKYGVNSEELKDLTCSGIKNLKVENIENFKKTKRYKLIRKPLGTIAKGITSGCGIAGVVNTVVPDLVPVLGTYLTSTSKLDVKTKFAIASFLASLPSNFAKKYLVLLLGGALGGVLYPTFKLVKNTSSNLKIISDRNKAKRIHKEKK